MTLGAPELCDSGKKQVQLTQHLNVGITIPVATFENIKLFDHLTPRLQSLLVEAKTVKVPYKWKYCWAKESAIYLRKLISQEFIAIARN